MRPISLITVLYLLGLLNVSGDRLPLTPAEADVIIAQREADKSQIKAARVAELEKAEVISEGQGTLPDGRKVIIREVEPPVWRKPKAPMPKQLTTPQFTVEEIARLKEHQQFQTHSVQMLSCTVYDRRITEVRWKHEGENFVAYTNADFNYLRGITTLETPTDRYDYFFGIGNVSSDLMRKPLPALPAFSPDRSEYILTEGASDNFEATAGLEVLLAHYDSNLNNLKRTYQRNQALAAAQKRYKEAHPEPKEDFILQFWVPEKKGKSE